MASVAVVSADGPQAVNDELPPNPPVDPPPAAPARESFRASLGRNWVATVACLAAVSVAVINGCTLYLDRDDKIEQQLTEIKTSLTAINTTLSGESGLAHRVVRLENLYMQNASAGAPAMPPTAMPKPPEVDLAPTVPGHGEEPD